MTQPTQAEQQAAYALCRQYHVPGDEAFEAAIAQALADAREQYAEWCDTQAHVLSSADDTMAGWHAGEPYRKVAAYLRARAGEDK